MTFPSRIQLIIAGIAVGGLLAVVPLGWWRLRPVEPHQPGSAGTRPAPVEVRITPPPDLRALAARRPQAGVAPLTPEQRAEERQTFLEQVAVAREWLRSPESRLRVEGAEQLGAYPTPEAGKALVNSLRHDISPEVRASAASSLANFQPPDRSAVGGLLSALADPSAEVRQAALGTLEIHLGALDAGSATRRHILRELGKLAKSRRLDPEILADLRVLLADP